MNKKALRILLVAISVLLPSFALYLVRTQVAPLEIAGLLAESHPVRKAYEAYRAKYDDQNDILALFVVPQSLADGTQLFEQNNAARLAFGAVQGIDRINYLAWSNYFREHEDGKFFFHSFFDQGHLKPEALALLTERPLWKNQILSKDQKAWLLPIKTLPRRSNNENYSMVDDLMRGGERLEAEFPGLKVHFIGPKIFKYHCVKELNAKQGYAFALVLMIIGGMCAWLFRSWLVVGVFGYTILISFSVMTVVILAVEKGVGPYASFSLFFVLMMASVTLIHLMSAMGQCEGTTVAEKLHHARKKIIVPCIGTTLACTLGFYGLWASDLMIIRNLGLYCIVGALVAFVVNLYALPAVINLFRIPLIVVPRISPHTFAGVSRFVVRHYWFILGCTALLFVGGFVLSSKLERNVDYYHQFNDDHAMTRAADEFARTFGFETTIDIILTPKSKDYLDLSTEKALAEMSIELKKIPNVIGTHSLYEYQEALRNLTQHGDQNSFLEQPLRGYFHQFDVGEVREDILLGDARELRMNVRIASFATKILTPTLTNIEELLNQERFRRSFDYKLAGMTTIHNQLSNEMTEQFINSVGSSLVLVFLFFLVSLRSVKWALIANLPDIFPLFCLGGIMYLCKISLDNDIIVACCIVLALSVDDTIHFMLSCRSHLRRVKDTPEAIRLAFADIAPALIATQLVFLFALPVLCIIPVKIMYHTTALLLIGLTIALAADLIVVPSLVLAFDNLQWSFFSKKIQKLSPRRVVPAVELEVQNLRQISE